MTTVLGASRTTLLAFVCVPMRPWHIVWTAAMVVCLLVSASHCETADGLRWEVSCAHDTLPPNPGPQLQHSFDDGATWSSRGTMTISLSPDGSRERIEQAVVDTNARNALKALAKKDGIYLLRARSVTGVVLVSSIRAVCIIYRFFLAVIVLVRTVERSERTWASCR